MKDEKATLLDVSQFAPKKKFLPSIYVASTTNYFALPKSKREKYGFYLMPLSLPWDYKGEDEEGWGGFEKRIKKEYPIQFFFRDTVYSFFSSLIYRLKHNYYYPIKTWFEDPNKNIRKCIPRHQWVDRSWLIWSINSAIILDFKTEMENGYVDWDHDEKVREIKAWVLSANDLILKKIPELEHEIDCVHKIWDKKNGDACFQKVMNLKKEIEEIKNSLLIKLVEYRDYLWT